MRTPIQLHGKLQFMTMEINHIERTVIALMEKVRKLPGKLLSMKPSVPDCLPENLFGIGLSVS